VVRLNVNSIYPISEADDEDGNGGANGFFYAGG